MWLKQCHKPPIWEWFLPPIKMMIWGMVCDCFTHMNRNGTFTKTWSSHFPLESANLPWLSPSHRAQRWLSRFAMQLSPPETDCNFGKEWIERGRTAVKESAGTDMHLSGLTMDMHKPLKSCDGLNIVINDCLFKPLMQRMVIQSWNAGIAHKLHPAAICRVL